MVLEVGVDSLEWVDLWEVVCLMDNNKGLVQEWVEQGLLLVENQAQGGIIIKEMEGEGDPQEEEVMECERGVQVAITS